MAQRTTRGTSTIIAPQNNSSQPEQDTQQQSPVIQDIQAWLAQGRALPSLKDGQYPVRLLSFAPVTTSPDSEKWYVRCEWQFPDRVVTDNRFMAGAQVLITQLVELFPGLTGLTPFEFFREMLKDMNTINCWVSHNTSSDGRTFRNLNFRAPAVTTAVEDVTPENF